MSEAKKEPEKSSPIDSCMSSTKSTLKTLWEAIYREDADGKIYIMDRDKSSWGRILLFYTVYYAFLGALFYAAITLYQSVWIPEIKEGNSPALSTRLGQPGIAAHPFNKMLPKYKGGDAMSMIKIDPNNLNDEVTKNYIDEMEDFLVKSGISSIDVEKAVENKELVVGLNLNKVIGWKPLNQGGAGQNPADSSDFVKDSIIFKCTPVDQNGAPDSSALYSSEFVDNKNYILPSAFPFNGLNEEGKSSYVKPSVLVRLKNLVPNEKNRFMCEALADNISKRGEKSTNGNMAKVGVGFIQFSVEIVE